MTIPFKIMNTIMAEYIVHGLNNKHTIINTYSGDILFNEFPASIPIAFYIELNPSKNFAGMIIIKLMFGKKVAMEGQAHADLRVGNPNIMAIPTGMVSLKGPSTMKLYLGVEGESLVKVMEKKLILNPALPSPNA